MSLTFLLSAPPRERHVAVDKVGERMSALDALLDLHTISEATRVALAKEYDELTALVNEARRDELIKGPDGSVVTVGALLFLLWCRLRLVLHDEEWCAEDRRYRNNPNEWVSSAVFCEANWKATPFDFLNKHPRYEYTQSELRLCFMRLLTADKIDDLDFTVELYEMCIDRVCIMLNYTMSSKSNDVDEYQMASNFLYDCYYLIADINQKLASHKKYDRRPNAKFDDLLAESRDTRVRWTTDMVLTAAGDDLAVVYKGMAMDQAVHEAERRIHARSHQAGTSYNVLVETRGREAAMRINKETDSFVIELIRHDVEDEIDAEEYNRQATELVRKRYGELSVAERNTLDGVLFDYTAERLLGIDFFGHVVTDETGRTPALRRVCYTDKWAMLDSTGEIISTFECLGDAFAVWLWWIGMYHSGIIYHPDTHAEIDCTDYIKSLLWNDEV